MSDHLAAIERHSYEGIADIVIANNAIIPESLRIKYASEHAREVMIDSINVLKRAKLVQGNLLLVRSDKNTSQFQPFGKNYYEIGQ